MFVYLMNTQETALYQGQGHHVGLRHESLPRDEHEVNGKIEKSRARGLPFTEQPNLWVYESLANMKDGHMKTVVIAVARMYVMVVHLIDELAASGGDSIPVTPKDVVSASMPAFAATITSNCPC